MQSHHFTSTGANVEMKTTLLEVAEAHIKQSRMIAASTLETQLISLVGTAAKLSKAESDIDKVAQIWEVMVGICDEFAKQIRFIYPEASLDRVLDARTHCEELRDTHRIDS